LILVVTALHGQTHQDVILATIAVLLRLDRIAA
jgi:hypothetical protein